jgi:ABC-type Fe3+/spermidine/putrescine transport system ATPase subunit
LRSPSAVPIIGIDGLVKRFGDVTAVDRLSFSVNHGEIFGLVGPDGAGKTATMRMLAGVMRPDSGAIVIDGIDAVADPEQAKPHVSYMPQRFGLYEDLTVDENIRFYADLFEVPAAVHRERAADLAAIVAELQAAGVEPAAHCRGAQRTGHPHRNRCRRMAGGAGLARVGAVVRRRSYNPSRRICTQRSRTRVAQIHPPTS